MAVRNNIVELAKFPRVKDAAAAALARMMAAGDDDAVYENALRDVVCKPATSLEGVQAKFERLCSLLDRLETGDVVTADGWETINALRDGIDEALNRFTARLAG